MGGSFSHSQDDHCQVQETCQCWGQVPCLNKTDSLKDIHSIEIAAFYPRHFFAKLREMRDAIYQ